MRTQINTSIQRYEQMHVYPKPLPLFFGLLYRGEHVSPPMPGFPGESVTIDGALIPGAGTDSYIVFTGRGSIIEVRSLGRTIVLDPQMSITHRFADALSTDYGIQMPLVHRRVMYPRGVRWHAGATPSLTLWG